MSRTISILVGLVILQVLVVVVLYLQQQPADVFRGAEPWLPLKIEQIATITFTEKKASDKENPIKTARLVNQDQQWILPDYYEFPVNNKKLSGVVDKLVAIEAIWPVAKTEETQKRFKVVAEDFERKITIEHKDGQKQVLYMGTSPGFKKVHARLAEQEEVYAIPFSVHQIDADPERWVNRSLFKQKQGDIQAIQLPMVQLIRKEDYWHIDGLQPNQQVNQDEVNALLAEFAKLSFHSVLGLEAPEVADNQLLLKLALTLADGTGLEYSFLPMVPKPSQNQSLAEGSDSTPPTEFALKVSNRPYYVKLQGGFVERVKSFNRDKLIQDKPKVTDSETESNNIDKKQDNDKSAKSKVKSGQQPGQKQKSEKAQPKPQQQTATSQTN